MTRNGLGAHQPTTTHIMNPTIPPPAAIRARRRGTAALLAAALFTALMVSVPTPARSEQAWEDTDTGLPGGDSTGGIALDRGRPRLLYWTSSQVGDLRFAWCDGDCHGESSWRSTRVVDDIEHPSLAGADLAVDRSGRVHIAYNNQDRQGIFYARCDGGCGSAGAWAHAKVDDTNWGGGLSLAVDPWGRPRIAYAAGPEVRLMYAACNEDCTSEGGWSRLRVLREQRGAYPSLALDGVKPRIAFDDWDEVHYLSCEARCLERGSWRETAVAASPNGGAQPSSLVVEGERAHIAFPTTSKYYVAYVRCEAGCSNPARWSEPVTVFDDTTSAPQLAVVDGRPRIAFVDPVLNAENPTAVHNEDHLTYAWCDTGCAPASGSNANWNVQRIVWPATWPSLALDGERPRIAYNRDYNSSSDPEPMGFASCDEDCGSAGTWPDPPSSPPPEDDPPPSSSTTSPPTTGSPSGSSPDAGGPAGGTSTTGHGGDGGSQGDGGGGGSSPAGGTRSGSDSANARDGGGIAAGGTTDDADRGGAGRSGGKDGGDHSGSDGGPVGDVARGVARAPGAAIDLITNPTKALSWPWGRISLSALAILLLAIVGRMIHFEAVDRYDRWRHGAPSG